MKSQKWDHYRGHYTVKSNDIYRQIDLERYFIKYVADKQFFQIIDNFASWANEGSNAFHCGSFEAVWFDVKSGGVYCNKKRDYEKIALVSANYSL